MSEISFPQTYTPATASDPDAGLAVLTTPAAAKTQAVLDKIRQGADGQQKMQTLYDSLTTIATGLSTISNKEAGLKSKLANNKAKLIDTLSDLPSVQIANIDTTTTAIVTTLGSAVSSDITNVNAAVGMANSATDPAVIEEFIRGMANYMVMRSELKMQALTQALKDVNGMRAATKERI